ncbi:MAG: hypothetical protein ACM3XM_21120, partial [Mycobacterium leprae]
MGFFTWLGRGAEKERAYARLKALQEQYGVHGERIIKLSARTDLARKSAGSTARAFEYVETVFVAATQQYARMGEQLQSIEEGLGKGRVGDFRTAESEMPKLGSQLDELAQRLSVWEAKWQEVPPRLEDARRNLLLLREQVAAAAAVVGAALTPVNRLASMERYADQAENALAAGNPIEADHLIDDLSLSMEKLSSEIATYASGAAAITDLEQEFTMLQERAAAELPAEAAAALAATQALMTRLRPALAAGKLEQFQADLLQIQKQ